MKLLKEQLYIFPEGVNYSVAVIVELENSKREYVILGFYVLAIHKVTSINNNN